MKTANPHILTIYSGSSRIKFALFTAGSKLQRILTGEVTRIGLPEATLQVKDLNQTGNFTRSVTAPNHQTALAALMDWIEDRLGPDTSIAVGHHVVHMADRNIASRSALLLK